MATEFGIERLPSCDGSEMFENLEDFKNLLRDRWFRIPCKPITFVEANIRLRAELGMTRCHEKRPIPLEVRYYEYQGKPLTSRFRVSPKPRYSILQRSPLSLKWNVEKASRIADSQSCIFSETETKRKRVVWIA